MQPLTWENLGKVQRSYHLLQLCCYGVGVWVCVHMCMFGWDRVEAVVACMGCRSSDGCTGVQVKVKVRACHSE